MYTGSVRGLSTDMYRAVGLVAPSRAKKGSASLRFLPLELFLAAAFFSWLLLLVTYSFASLNNGVPDVQFFLDNTSTSGDWLPS